MESSEQGEDDSETPLRLPFAAEFSPSIIDLKEMLSIVDTNEANFEAMREAVRERYFLEHAQKRKNAQARRKVQETLAYNALRGMSSYGLIDDDWVLSDLGRRLLDAESEDEMYDEFARHILIELPGLDVLDAVRTLQMRGIEVKKTTLHRQLEEIGYVLPNATTHHTKLLQWLRSAGLLPPSGYDIDEERLFQLIGDMSDLKAEWAQMPHYERAFVRTLKALSVGGETTFATSDVINQTVADFGDAVFPRPDQIRSDVTSPLEEAGWITVQFASAGRGGKSGTLTVTDKLIEADLEVVERTSRSLIPVDILQRLNTPLDEVFEDLESPDKHAKGLALEILACRIAHDLGLLPVQFRLLSSKTGGAEVDLTAEGIHLHHSRWLFQCKNTATVALSALAKEVGMAVMLRGHVIVMVTTGTFASSVAGFADELMSNGYLEVVLVDGEVLDSYRNGGRNAIQQFFRSQAESVFKLKRGQVTETEEASSGTGI